MEPGSDATAPYRVAWVAAALAAVVVLVLALLVLVGVPRWFPGVADCTVVQGASTVELSTLEAENAASIAAAGVRRGIALPKVSAVLADELDLSSRDAQIVASALTGRLQHALVCRHGGARDTEPDRLDRFGLTARAERVRRDLENAFGPQRLGGFAPGGVHTGHMVGSAHYEGRAVDVFFRPINHRHKVLGWALAQYLVAHAERLQINTVIFDAEIWTAQRAGEGWRRYAPDTSGRSAKVAAILRHRDHVHVDVAD
jgi:hypothetical protein